MEFTIKDFFRHSFCITTSDEQYKRFKDRFVDRGLPRRMLPKKFVGTYPKHTMKDRTSMQMCILSHFSIINMASTLNLPYVTIFEDDALPMKDFYPKLSEFLSEGVPDGASAVYFGNLHFIDIQEKTSGVKFASMTSNLYGTHAYTVFKGAYANYLKVNRASERQINPDWCQELFKPCYASTKSFFIQYRDELQHPEFLMDKQNLNLFL